MHPVPGGAKTAAGYSGASVVQCGGEAQSGSSSSGEQPCQVTLLVNDPASSHRGRGAGGEGEVLQGDRVGREVMFYQGKERE